MGLGLPSWVWVWACRGFGSRFAATSCGDYGLLFFLFMVLIVGEGGVDGLGFFFFFFLVLMVNYRLLVVVLGVCSAAMMGLW